MFGMRQTSTSKPIKSLLVSPQDTHAQLKIVAAELSWAYHMNQQALLYHTFDSSMELRLHFLIQKSVPPSS